MKINIITVGLLTSVVVGLTPGRRGLKVDSAFCIGNPDPAFDKTTTIACVNIKQNTACKDCAPAHSYHDQSGNISPGVCFSDSVILDIDAFRAACIRYGGTGATVSRYT